jgi:hypothetical protein
MTDFQNNIDLISTAKDKTCTLRGLGGSQQILGSKSGYLVSTLLYPRPTLDSGGSQKISTLNIFKNFQAEDKICTLRGLGGGQKIFQAKNFLGQNRVIYPSLP